MSKERLEAAKLMAKMLRVETRLPHDFPFDLVDWLVEQAERVQELEEENKRIRQMKYHEAYEQGKFDTNMKVWYEVPKLEQQIRRYREALEFYANEENWTYGIAQHIFRGEKARQVLEGEE